jgi:hypothetical protein
MPNLMQIVPTMTGYTAPAGYELSADGEYNGSALAWYAADASLINMWYSLAAQPSWLEVKLPAAKTVVRYGYCPGGSYIGTAWKFQGYNGSTWDDLDSRTGQSPVDAVVSLYDIASPASYSRYRLLFSASALADIVTCKKIELWVEEDLDTILKSAGGNWNDDNLGTGDEANVAAGVEFGLSQEGTYTGIEPTDVPAQPVVSSVTATETTVAIAFTITTQTDTVYLRYRAVNGNGDWSAESTDLDNVGDGTITVEDLDPSVRYEFILYGKRAGFAGPWSVPVFAECMTIGSGLPTYFDQAMLAAMAEKVDAIDTTTAGIADDMPTLSEITASIWGATASSYTTAGTMGDVVNDTKTAVDNLAIAGTAVLYAPTSATRNTGTDQGGDYTNLSARDDSNMVTGEVVTGVGLEVTVIRSTSDSDEIPSLVNVYGYYKGVQEHHVEVRAWNYLTGAWDEIGLMINRSAAFEYSFPLNSSHHSATGEMKLNFLHDAVARNASHRLYLDWISWQKVATNSTLGSDIAAIRAKTDNLPEFPANEETVATVETKTDELWRFKGLDTTNPLGASGDGISGKVLASGDITLTITDTGITRT